MKNFVIVTLLLTGGMALAEGTENIIEMYEREKCTNGDCQERSKDELFIMSTEKGIELQFTRTFKNKQVCSFRAPARYNEKTKVLSAKLKYSDWDNGNHMLWTRTCELKVDQYNGRANVWAIGSCEKFCEYGNMNAEGLRGL